MSTRSSTTPSSTNGAAPKDKKKDKKQKVAPPVVVKVDVEEEEAVRKPRVEDGVVDDRVDIFGWETWEEKVAKWVYNGDERNTQSVWVAGVEVYRKGGFAPTWAVERPEPEQQ